MRVKPWSVTDTHTTTDTLDRLHGELHKLREGSTMVKVQAEDLRALLHDHAAFCTVIKTL